MANFAAIAIGASAGGVQALIKLASDLPVDIPAALLVVQHVGPRHSFLPELLSKAGPLPALHAHNLTPVAPGCIFVAPPDHHMTALGGLLRTSRGPRENWARPAIDPLFRSVAKAYGAKSVGVILTGGLNDGSAGLYLLRKAGGIAVVQQPGNAECAEMPTSALRYAGADYCVALDEIAPLLVALARKIATGRKPEALLEGGQR